MCKSMIVPVLVHASSCFTLSNTVYTRLDVTQKRIIDRITCLKLEYASAKSNRGILPLTMNIQKNLDFCY